MNPRQNPFPGNGHAKSGPTALNSWKEIANYIGRGVRTVQRWERELGLPVRRPHDHLRSPVIAIPSEIDDWLRRGKPRRGGNRRAVVTSQLAQNTQALNEKLRKMCERTQQLSETVSRTVAQSKQVHRLPGRSERLAS